MVPVALAQVDGTASEPSIYNFRYLAQVVGSLLLVLGCALGVLYLIKKVQGMPAGDRRNAIRILGALKVGSRERILLLQSGEKQLLVGVAAGSVRTLHVFDQTDVPVSGNDGSAAGFDSLLQRATARESRS
ncbi:MAG: flagellar biosynthetic protein FliO [Halioglobus sp.]|nr:flagellar biosynthetic protein FliO [Halioglobus sp.]